MFRSGIYHFLTLRRLLLLALLLALPAAVLAHPELQAQIDLVSGQIVADAGNAGLYLKRGNLYRRHQDWEAAYRDFDRARELDPSLRDVDWLEGRALVDAGRYREGERMLSSYLEAAPDNASALQTRARARSSLGRHLEAAADYGRAIEHAEQPSPGLFDFQARELAAAGPENFPEAAAVAAAGLDRFPGEVSLLGLSTDFALAAGDADAASRQLDQLKPGLEVLPQWELRRALVQCLEGDQATARETFVKLYRRFSSDDTPRTGTFSFPPEALRELAVHAAPESCSQAANAALLASKEGSAR
jgi:predicted Zn-dependent protease